MIKSVTPSIQERLLSSSASVMQVYSTSAPLIYAPLFPYFYCGQPCQPASLPTSQPASYRLGKIGISMLRRHEKPLQPQSWEIERTLRIVMQLYTLFWSQNLEIYFRICEFQKSFNRTQYLLINFVQWTYLNLNKKYYSTTIHQNYPIKGTLRQLVKRHLTTKEHHFIWMFKKLFQCIFLPLKYVTLLRFV